MSAPATIRDRLRALFGVASKDLDAYFAEARAWDGMYLADLVRTARRERLLVYVLGGICIALTTAIVVMMPLKEIRPALVRVDNSTGIVDQIEWITDARVDYGEAVARTFVWQYIACREAYTVATYASAYERCAIMTAPDAPTRALVELFDHRSDKSLYARYGNDGQALIKFKSITFLRPQLARLRFQREEKLPGADAPVVSHWEATVAFRYIGDSMAQSARLLNPLGFQVVEYRVDPETVPK